MHVDLDLEKIVCVTLKPGNKENVLKMKNVVQKCNIDVATCFINPCCFLVQQFLTLPSESLSPGEIKQKEDSHKMIKVHKGCLAENCLAAEPFVFGRRGAWWRLWQRLWLCTSISDQGFDNSVSGFPDDGDSLRSRVLLAVVVAAAAVQRSLLVGCCLVLGHVHCHSPDNLHSVSGVCGAFTVAVAVAVEKICSPLVPGFHG